MMHGQKNSTLVNFYSQEDAYMFGNFRNF